MQAGHENGDWGADAPDIETRVTIYWLLAGPLGSRAITAGRLAQDILGTDWVQAFRSTNDRSKDCDAVADESQCILTYLAAYEYDTALLKFTLLEPDARQSFLDRYFKTTLWVEVLDTDVVLAE